MFFRMLEKASESFERTLKHQLDVEQTRYSVCLENIKEYCKFFSHEEEAAICNQMEVEHMQILKDMSTEEQGKLRSKMKELSEVLCKPIKIEINRFQTIEKCQHIYRSKLLELETEVELHCDWFTSYMNEDLNKFENIIQAKSYDTR